MELLMLIQALLLIHKESQFLVQKKDNINNVVCV